VKRHTTVPKEKPPHEQRPPKPAPRVVTPKPVTRDARWARTTAPRHRVGRLAGTEESTLLDVIDNLLGKGVVLNADLILALADVDLIYVRLSALLSAADRVLRRPPR
jgi:hypothetical protein